MQIFLFAAGINGVIEELQPAIAELVGINNLETFRSMTNFTHRLQQPVDNSTIAVIVTTNTNDLADILAIHPWLEKVKIILVLPDYETETIAQGHKLRPRFLTALGGNLQDVVAVLKKMLAYGHRTKGREWS